jgi:DtxR family Mn-dependent transcriptional regulator
MSAEGLVNLDGRIQLTEQGVSLAERIVRRHRLAERFLTDVLELSWADAHRQANRWEHVIDESVEAAMDRLLGQPTTCPHGNPIPGSDYHDPAAVPLNGLDVGATFVVTRIPEELEFTPGVLDFLEENTVVPGRNGVLTAASPDGSVTVSIDQRVVGLGTFASSRILVLPEPAPA